MRVLQNEQVHYKTNIRNKIKSREQIKHRHTQGHEINKLRLKNEIMNTH